MMSVSNGTKAPLNGHVASSNADGRKSGPQAVLEFWRQSGERLMRSGEEFARGMISISQSEVELGQELLKRRLASFRPGVAPNLQSYGQNQIRQNIEELECMIRGVRKVSDEFRQVLGKTVELLIKDEQALAPESIAAALHKENPIPAQTARQPARAQA
jgi:tRNA(Met) C34 N-acetyltransferase TmcA